PASLELTRPRSGSVALHARHVEARPVGLIVGLGPVGLAGDGAARGVLPDTRFHPAISLRTLPQRVLAEGDRVAAAPTATADTRRAWSARTAQGYAREVLARRVLTGLVGATRVGLAA